MIEVADIIEGSLINWGVTLNKIAKFNIIIPHDD